MLSSSPSAQDLTASIAQAVAVLAADTDALRQSATFTVWLRTMSAFHAYSFGNQLLIWSQRPDATRVAGFHKWKSLKRFVTKGQKGIRILAPILPKTEAEEGPSIVRVPPGGRPASTGRIAGFRVATVFDLSQTDGEPLAELPECNAVSGGETLLPMIERAIAELGISMTYKPLGGPDGLSRGGAIEIEEALATPARCGVLIHELAHELLEHKASRETTTKQGRELEAEAIAYAVMCHFRMDLPSQFYIAGYGVTAEMLTAALPVISATAKRIIGLVQPEGLAVGEGVERDALPAASFDLPLAA